MNDLGIGLEREVIQEPVNQVPILRFCFFLGEQKIITEDCVIVAGKRVGKYLVIVGASLEGFQFCRESGTFLRAGTVILPNLSEGLQGGVLIRLRKSDVKGHHFCTGAFENINGLGETAPGKWPMPKHILTFLVNGHNYNGRSRCALAAKTKAHIECLQLDVIKEAKQ